MLCWDYGKLYYIWNIYADFELHLIYLSLINLVRDVQKTDLNLTLSIGNGAIEQKSYFA